MSNPFRESILGINLVELTGAIDVTDQLLLCLHLGKVPVLTEKQYDEIRVRRVAVFSSYYRYMKTLYCVRLLDCTLF